MQGNEPCLVYRGLGLAAHALHVLLILLLDVLHADAVDAIKQRHLQRANRGQTRIGFCPGSS